MTTTMGLASMRSLWPTSLPLPPSPPPPPPPSPAPHPPPHRRPSAAAWDLPWMPPCPYLQASSRGSTPAHAALCRLPSLGPRWPQLWCRALRCRGRPRRPAGGGWVGEWHGGAWKACEGNEERVRCQGGSWGHHSAPCSPPSPSPVSEPWMPGVGTSASRLHSPAAGTRGRGPRGPCAPRPGPPAAKTPGG